MVIVRQSAVLDWKSVSTMRFSSNRTNFKRATPIPFDMDNCSYNNMNVKDNKESTD